MDFSHLWTKHFYKLRSSTAMIPMSRIHISQDASACPTIDFFWLEEHQIFIAIKLQSRRLSSPKTRLQERGSKLREQPCINQEQLSVLLFIQTSLKYLLLEDLLAKMRQPSTVRGLSSSSKYGSASQN